MVTINEQVNLNLNHLLYLKSWLSDSRIRFTVEVLLHGLTILGDLDFSCKEDKSIGRISLLKNDFVVAELDLFQNLDRGEERKLAERQPAALLLLASSGFGVAQ